jgi:hypothetical protein
MKKNNLGKHHFWILFGAAAILVPVAFLLMWILVSGSIGEKKDAYAKQLSELDSANSTAKSSGEVKVLEARKDQLTKEKALLWESNYNRQDKAGVFEWPTGGDARLKAHNEKKYKFGYPVQNIGNEFEGIVLTSSFDKAYNKLAEDLGATKFARGSWQGALRYVSNWGKLRIEPEYLWLALEDYWVQKALLQAIAEVNNAGALFTDVTPKDNDNPLKRTFRNRVWELELEVVQKANKQQLQGVIRNLTDRLQVLGMEKSMRVKVWMDNAANPVHDFEFLIQGETVPGRKEVKCEPREITNVSPVTKLAKVVQIYDEATSPVRLVNTIELSMLDHKNKGATLEVPKHIEDIAANEPAPNPTAGGQGFAGPGEEGPGGPGGITLGGIGSQDGGGGFAGMFGMGAATSSNKTGGPSAVLRANKMRYLKRTEDVRRMPVALSVVIDRDFVNDLLVAFANSPLRFQVTQTQWARYRGSLGSSAADGTMPGAPLLPGGPGGIGTPDGSDASGGGGRSTTMPSAPGAFGGPGGPAGMGTMVTSVVGIPPEANSGLVEFAVFGVVSLYEKKEKPPESPADPQAAPMDGNTQPGDPKPMDPAAKDKEGTPANTPNEPKGDAPRPDSK